MAGVIFEGGSLRCIFTAGVIDALLDHNIHFDYVIGVSAGITNGLSYCSNQRGRNLDILKKYRNNPKYLSFHNLLRCGSIFDPEFLFDELPNSLNLFDHNTLNQYRGSVYSVVTDIDSADAVYMDTKHLDEKHLVLQATCSIPFLSKEVTINNRQYYDGGISDAIPIKKAIADGSKKNLIILTQPNGYIKKNTHLSKFAASLLKKRSLNLTKSLLKRADRYNETLSFIKELEQGENTVVLRPLHKIKSFEKNISKLEETYRMGYDLAILNIDKIKELIG